MDKKKKNITLRLDKETYEKLFLLADSENRSVANFIETIMLQKLEEKVFVSDYEMQEILSNKDLLQDLKEGSEAAKAKKGKFV